MNIRLISQGMNLLGAVMALDRQPELWGAGQTIMLRGPHEGSYANYLAFDMLPQLRPFVFGTMGLVEGEVLGEVKLVKIQSGESLDLGLAPIGQHHYVISLEGLAGVSLAVESEQLPLDVGQAWFVSGNVPGQIVNRSASWATVLVLAISPNRPGELLPPME